VLRVDRAFRVYCVRSTADRFVVAIVLKCMLFAQVRSARLVGSICLRAECFECQ
jgi:hypothetical protein